MSSTVYNNAKRMLGDGYIHWDGYGSVQTFKILLVNASYVPDIDTHVYVSSVTNELTGGNYVRKTLTTLSAVTDLAGDKCDYKADNVTWTAINAGTAAAAVLFLMGTNDADSQLIAYIDFTDTVTNGGDFTLKWDGQVSNGRLFSIG